MPTNTSAREISRPFPDAFLFAYSKEHLYYEVDMFFEMVDVWGRLALDHGLLAILGRPNKVEEALLESSVIHFRNIVDFLFTRHPLPPNGVVADDFSEVGAWERLRPTMSETLAVSQARAHREIAPLTTSRIASAPATKAWDFTALADELRPVLQLFAVEAKSSRLWPGFARAIRRGPTRSEERLRDLAQDPRLQNLEIPRALK